MMRKRKKEKREKREKVGGKMNEYCVKAFIVLTISLDYADY